MMLLLAVKIRERMDTDDSGDKPCDHPRAPGFLLNPAEKTRARGLDNFRITGTMSLE